MNLATLAISITAIDASGNIFKRVRENFQQTATEFEKLWKGGEKLKAGWKGFQKVGTYAAGAFGSIAALTGVHQIVNGLADAQEGFNKIEVLSGKTTEQMDAFKGEIYKIAAETARGPEEILNAAISKIGERMSDADIFATLRQEGLYATASFSKNMEGISESTVKMSRLMGMSYQDASKAFAGILEVSKGTGKLSFEGITSAVEPMMRDAGRMGLGGVKGAVQIAAAAKIASKTMSEDEATASVQSFFSDLQKAKTEGSLQKVAGIDLDTLKQEAVASGNAMGYIVDKLMKATGGNEVELSKLFKSESTRNLIRSLQAERKEFDDIWQSAEKANDSQAIKDKEKAMKSIKAQWGLFRTQLTNLMNSDAAPWLNKITGALTWLTKGGKGAGAAMLALKATFAVAVVAKGIGAIVSAVTFLASPIGLIAVAVVGLIALGVLVYKKWANIKAFFVGTFNWLKGLFDKAPWLAAFMPVIGIPMLIINHWSHIKAFFGTLFGWLKTIFNLLKPIFAPLIDYVVASTKVAMLVLGKMFNWLKPIFGKIMDVAKVVVSFLGWAIFIATMPFIALPVLIIRNWDKIKGFFGGLFNWLNGLFTRIIGAIRNKIAEFKEAGKNIIKAIWEGIKGFVSKPIEAIKGMVGKIRNFLPFSPAKEGPLKDLHKIRIVETIADTIKPGSLVSKMGSVLKTATSIAMPAITAIAPGARSAAAPSIQIVINIDARGAAPGAEQNIKKAIMDAMPDIERRLAQSAAANARAMNRP